jgi:hypothetical protein
MSESDLVGRKIVEVRTMTKKELEREGWEGNFPTIALVLDDGQVLYPSMDTEGNAPGALFGSDKMGKTYVHLADWR